MATEITVLSRKEWLAVKTYMCKMTRAEANLIMPHLKTQLASIAFKKRRCISYFSSNLIDESLKFCKPDQTKEQQMIEPKEPDIINSTLQENIESDTDPAVDPNLVLQEAAVCEADDSVIVLPEPLLQFFKYDHLPEHLRVISQKFGLLAEDLCNTLPRNPERTVALRKLLEAKDCAVRASIYK